MQVRLKLLTWATFFLFSLAGLPGQSGAAVAKKTPGVIVDGAPAVCLWDIHPVGADYLIALADIARFTAASYNFSPGDASIYIKRGSHSLKLFIDRPKAVLNNRPASISQPPRMIDGVIFVPFNTTVSAIGYEITFDSSGNSFSLTRIQAGQPRPDAVTAREPVDLIPAGSSFVSPFTPEGGAAGGETTVKGDIDGDGNEEFAACYRTPGGTFGVVLYRKREEGFSKLWQKEDVFPPSLLEMTDLNGGGSELLVGWWLGAPLGNTLEVYTMRGGIPELIYSCGYHKIEHGDFDHDGKVDLAVWQKDKGQTFSVQVLAWNGTVLTPFEFCPEYYEQVISYLNGIKGSLQQAKAAQYYLAEACLRSKKFDQALACVGDGLRLTQSYPRDSYFYGLKGLALYNLGRYSEALPALEFAAHGQTGIIWPEARFALSRCYAETGQADRSRLELARAISEGNLWPGFDRAVATAKAEREKNVRAMPFKVDTR